MLIGGTDVTDLVPSARNVSIVFQNLALYPDKTVFDNLAFPLAAGQGEGVVVRDRPPRQGDGGDLADRAAPEAPPRSPLRRRAATGGDRPMPRARPARLPPRRATFRARRSAAPADARGAEVPAAGSRTDARLRDARPGRGDEHGRPDLRPRPGQRATGAIPRTRSTTVPSTPSWPRRSGMPPMNLVPVRVEAESGAVQLRTAAFRSAAPLDSRLDGDRRPQRAGAADRRSPRGHPRRRRCPGGDD